MNAAEAIAVYPRPHYGGSWRLRAALLVAALVFHIALLSMLKTDRQIVLQATGISPSFEVTLVVTPPLPSAASSSAAEHPAAVEAGSDAGQRATSPNRERSADAALTGPPRNATLPARRAPAVPPRPLIEPTRNDVESGQTTGQQINGQINGHLDGQLDVENLERQAVLIAQDHRITEEMPQDRLVHAPTAKEKFTAAVNKSERKDCRNAYSGFGPLAIPLLVENTITGTGCKW